MSRLDDVKGGANKVITPKKKSRLQSIMEDASNGNVKTGVDEKYINTFLNDVNDYYSQLEKDSKTIGYSNASSIYDKYSSKGAELGTKANTIKAFLHSNKSKLDKKTYESLSSYIDKFDTNRRNVSQQLRNTASYYSKWETEEEYNIEHKETETLNNLYSMSSAEIKAEMDKNATDNSTQISALQKEYDTLNNKIIRYGRGDKGGWDSSDYQDAKKRKDSLGRQIKQMSEKSGIAYTTSSGQNITWQSLYDDKIYEETIDTLYNKYSAMPDWKEKSSFTSKAKKAGERHEMADLGEDILLEYIHGDDELRADITNIRYGQAVSEQIGDNHGLKKWMYNYGKDGFDSLEDKEKELWTYISQTNNLDARNDLYSLMRDTIEERHNVNEIKETYQLAQEYPIGASILSVGYNLRSAGEYLMQTLPEYVSTGELKKNQSAELSSAMRQGVAETVDWNIGDWDAFDFVYNTGMSMIDSTVAQGFGKFGGVVLGLSAAAQGTNDALDRGMSNGQAFMSGLASGIFEAVFETWSIGAFGDLSKNLKRMDFQNISKYIGKNMWNNAKEELLTEIANISYDYMFNGEFSQYETSIRQYMNMGMSESESKKKVATELGVQVAEAFGSGALMGFGFSVFGNGNQGGVIATANRMSQEGKAIKESGQVGNLVELGRSLEEGTDSYEFANKVTDKSTALAIGSLLEIVEGDILEANRGDIVKSLERKGYDTDKANRLADLMLDSENSMYSNTLGGTAEGNTYKNIIGNKKSTVNQRTQPYIEILDALEKGNVNKESTSSDAKKKSPQTVSAPYSNEYIDSVSKESSDAYRESIVLKEMAKGKSQRIAELITMGLPAEVAESLAIAQLSTPANSAPTVENIAESKYDVSADGKTSVIESGKVVNIQKIESISKDGEVKIKTNDGMVINASELSFGTDAEALFVENIGKIKIGKNPISTTSANYLYMTAMDAFKDNPKMTADEAMSLIKGLTESYIYGVYNLGRSKLTARNEDGSATLFAGELTQEQRKYAYELGTKDGVSKAEADQKVIDELVEKAKPKTSKKSIGKVIFEKGANVDESTLTKTQKANLEGIKLLAKLSSIEFHIYRSDKVGNDFKYTMPDGTVTSANGWFVAGTNEIWVDLNAGNSGEGTMIRTAAHEISHYIKVWSPLKWKAMADLLMKSLAENGIVTEQMLRSQIEKIKRRYKADNETIPSETELLDEAYEELVCDALSDMLTDGSIVNFMAEVKAKDRNLGQKILDAIKSLLKKWGLIIDDYKGRELDTAEAQALSQLEDTFKKLQELYREVFMDANEVVAKLANSVKSEAEKSQKNTTIEGNAKFADRQHYWVSGFSHNEMSYVERIAKHEVELTDNYIDIENKWLYNNRKDKPYFALYSTAHIDNPTVMYASKGEQAEFEHQFLLDYFAEKVDENERIVIRTETIDKILENYGYVGSRGNVHSGNTLGRGSNKRNVVAYSRNSRNRPSEAFLNCLRNIAETQKRNERRGVVRYSERNTDTAGNKDHLHSSDKEKLEKKKVNFSLRKDIDRNKIKRAYSLARSRDSRLIAEAEDYESKNKSRLFIYNKTGLVRDPKGIWLYELDDRKMKFYLKGDARKKNDPNYQEYLKYEKIVNSYPDLDFDENGDIILTDEQAKVYDRYCDLIEILENQYGTIHTLKDYVVYDELFEKYPQIGDAEFLIWDFKESNVLGAYDPEYNVIKISQELYKGKIEKRSLEDTIVHEIQHAIQTFDERQSGSNPKYWNVRLARDGYLPYSDWYEREVTPFEAYLLTAGEIEAREVAQRIKDGDVMNPKVLPNLFWDYALYPDDSLDSPERKEKKYSTRKTEYNDSDYFAALDNGDIESLQHMVDAAALNAGYTERLYHQTGADFTEFNTEKQKAGKFDHELPEGIFLKPSDKDIGLSGKKQMELFAKIQNPLHFGTRHVAAEYWKRNIPGYADVSREIASIDRAYSAKIAQAEREIREYTSEWKKSHPKTPSSELYKDTDFQRLFDLQDSITAEWESKSEEASLRAKQLINDFVYKSEYDGIIIDLDQGSGGRFTKTYIVYDSSQLKTADPVTYNNEGNVIALSERFNSEKKDIRYSERDGSAKNEFYSESQYNNFGWVRANDVLTASEYNTLLSRYADYKHNKDIYPTTRFGEGVIHSFDYPNVFIYVKGTIKNPQITKIVRITEDNSELVRIIREEILKYEYQQVPLPYQNVQLIFGEGILNISRKRDCIPFQEYKRQQEREFGKTDNYADRIEQERARNPEKSAKFDKNYQIKRDDRYPNASNRAILVNALESTVQNDIEKKKLAEYKKKISQIEVEEQRLSKIQKQLFTMGSVEPAQRKQLQFEAKQIANRINTYDRQLLSLESTTALKNILNREKVLAMKRQKQKDNEYLKQYKEKVAKDTKELIARNQESRKRTIESREKTAMRHRIKTVVNDLNNLLLKPTKERHVPEEMRIAVSEALSIVNMDTVDADTRVAKYNNLIAKAKDPDVIASLTATRDRILEQGNRLSEKLSKLKEAYGIVRDSADDSLRSMYDDVIYNKIESVQRTVGKTPLRNMTLVQLESVYELYKMVLTTVRDSNKAFAENLKMSRLELGSNTFTEIKENNKVRDSIKHETMEKFLWQNLKPMQAMKTIGSGTLQNLWNNILYGQEIFAQDYYEAVEFAKEMKEKYGYKKWNLDKLYSFESKSGKTMKLNLEHMMSIYAYSKRTQADEHIEYGGIVLNEGVRKVKNKLGRVVEVRVNDSTAYRLDRMQVGKIIETLEQEAPGAKKFVDEMQKYLSETMGAKGNEVSMKLYGINLFKEEHYFPLKSSKDFKEAANAKLKGDVKIKNKGMTKSTVEHARNPIVLENFLDVWGNHINEMAMYHGLVLPLEDFSRTINYSFKADESLNTDAESVRTALHDAFGDNADNYLNELLKAINGGVLHDSSAQFADKMISKFKKAKVMASLSVIVQQPSAIIRAMGIIDPKYFVAQNFNHKVTWEELKKYCPTAIIKETGSFDTNMGRTIVDMIRDEQGFTDKVGDFLGRAPAYMDEIGWNMIWRALKKKVATEQKLSGEALLQECGKHMTLIINETQVYDSVMSRSELMRSKNELTKMATAFGAEPTTVANMMYGAALDFKRGKRGIATKTIAATISSVVINGLVSSFVYALRDDDEEETFLEKYLSAATTEVLDGLNPLTYIPFIKDIYSLFQGYKVERTDMALIGDVVDALNTFYNVLDSEAYEGVSRDEIAKHFYVNSVPLLTSICDMFGLPVGNILRDAKAIIINDNVPMSQSSSSGTEYAFKEGAMSALPKFVQKIIGTDSKQDKLYDAIVNGDTTYIERLKSGYKDDKDYETAVRKALRENDSRIREAAEARIAGNIAEYTRIVKEIKAEGFFSQDTIVASINNEINAINMGQTPTDTSSENKESSIYKMDDYYASIVGGDQATAYVVKEDSIKIDVANGKDRDEAEDSFNSRFTSYLREKYEDGYLSGQDAERLLVNYGEKSKEDAASKVQYWKFKQKYPNYDDLSEEAVTKYYDKVEPYNISINVYYDYSKQSAKCKGVDANGDGKTDSGSKKAQVLKVINSLPISNAQKDVLYYLNGWSARTMYEAPWH